MIMMPFTPEDLKKNPPRMLARGRWANADLSLFENGSTTWVIKDFSPCKAAGQVHPGHIHGAA